MKLWKLIRSMKYLDSPFLPPFVKGGSALFNPTKVGPFPRNLFPPTTGFLIQLPHSYARQKLLNCDEFYPFFTRRSLQIFDCCHQGIALSFFDFRYIWFLRVRFRIHSHLVIVIWRILANFIWGWGGNQLLYSKAAVLLLVIVCKSCNFF